MKYSKLFKQFMQIWKMIWMCLNCSFVALMRNNVCFVFAVTPFLDLNIYMNFKCKENKFRSWSFICWVSFLFKPSTQKLKDYDCSKDLFFITLGYIKNSPMSYKSVGPLFLWTRGSSFRCYHIFNMFWIYCL